MLFRLTSGVAVTAALSLTVLTGSVGRAAEGDPAPPGFPGPFTAAGLAHYVIHQGGPLTVRLEATRPSAELVNNGGIKIPHAIFWQFYDADGRLVAQQYYRFADDGELAKTFSTELDEAPAGIYQFRYAKSPGAPLATTLTTQPPTGSGVMPCRTRMSDITDAWLYVPANAREVRFSTYATDAELLDETGKTLGKSSAGKPIPVTPGTVVRVRVQRAAGRFGIRGLPPILCPDAATARAIGGSVEIAPNGRVLAHKFQLRMRQWMHGLTPADLAVEEQDLAKLETEWLADPRNAGLLGIMGPFNHLPRILQDQILDPADPEYGLGTNTSWLGPVYVIDKPLNPYRRKRAILNRILLHEFATFLKLSENGTFKADNWYGYAGGDAMAFRQRAFQFGYVAPHIDPALRDLWFEGVSKVLARLGMTRVTCENQTAHWPLDLHMVYVGSGREVYRTMARDYIAAMEDPALNTFMKTGYQQEAYGPDATYQGLCTAQQAIYFKYSGDSAAREGLRRVYDLFNHTVAPEPDGTMQGASSFSHRTQGSWVIRQYNGGLRLMANELPEAGVWYRDHDPEARRKEAVEEIRVGLRTRWDDAWYEENMRWLSTYAYHPWVAFFHRYVFPFGDVRAGPWPALSETPFFKNLNNEFVFVKRARYYAVVYNGRTSHAWARARHQAVPHPKGWELQEGKLVPATASAGKGRWCQTQGLCLFWTPQLGNCLLGKNWNVYTAQMTRADLADGKVAWPDYWTLEGSVDADSANVVQYLRLFDQPVAVHRSLAFTEEGVRLRVELNAESDFAAERIVEQFPFLHKEGLRVRFGQDDSWSDTPGPGVSTVRFEIGERGAVELRFTRPFAVRLRPPCRHYRQDIGCLEVPLGTTLSAGERRSFECMITGMAE